MKKRKLSFWKVALVATLIASLASVIPILAADYTVGVKAGDWIKYGEIHASWTGTGTDLSGLTDMNNLDWMKIDVKSISGTKVTAETTGQFKNGTTMRSSSGTVDVTTSQTTTGFFMIPLISAELEEGDSIQQQPSQGSPVVTVNGTVTRTYCGAMRSVNYIDISTSASGTSVTAEVYWDKATGIMLESHMSMSTTTPVAQSMEFSLKAVETNMWSADAMGFLSSNLIYIAIAIVVLVVVVVAGVFFMKRRKPSLPPAAPASTVSETKTD